MARELDIKLDGLEMAVEKLRLYADKQVPYATALALTRTAQDCQKALKSELGKHFTMRERGPHGPAAGIRVRAAKKRDLDSGAAVGSIDPYMAMQARGGTKRARAKTMGVPLVGGARAKKTSKVMQNKWPSRLLADYTPPPKGRGYSRPGADKRLFIAPIKGGPQVGIYKRRRRATWKGGKRTPIQLMYAFRSRVRVPRRWPMDDTVKRTVRQMWRVNAYNAILEAMESSK